MSSAPAADVMIAPPEPAPLASGVPTDSHGPSAADGRAWLWFWVACVIAPLPMLVPYFAGQWQREHYQYFPFTFVAVAALIRARWNGQIYPPGGPTGAPRDWFSWGLLFLGWASVATSVAIFSPWLGAVGFVAIATAWLRSLRETNGRSLAILALPLLTLVRLPLSFDSLLIIRLQGWTTQLASWFLDLVSIPHMTVGNVIELTTRELFVAEACSGIQSVFTLLFLASLLVVHNRHPLWFAPLFGLAAVVLAVFSNALRVAIVAAAEAILAVDWTTGLSHDAVGYFTLIVAALLLLSFERCVSELLHPIGDFTEIRQLQDNPAIAVWNRVVDSSKAEEDGDGVIAEETAAAFETARPNIPAELRTALIGLSLLLGVVSLVSVVYRGVGSSQRLDEASITKSFIPPDGMLDEVWDEHCVVEHEIARDGENPRLGKAADIWTVSENELRYQVVLSQPYFGWHELCICYENLHWQLADRSIANSAFAVDEETPEGGSTQYAFARFRRDDGRHGYLLFSAISYDGLVSPPPPGLGTTAYLRQRFTQDAYAIPTEMMMLQLWAETPERLRFETVQKLKDRFLRARAEILHEINSSPQVAAASAPAR